MTNHLAHATIPRKSGYLGSLSAKRWISGNNQIVEKRRGAEVRPPPSQVNFNTVK